MNTMLLEMVKEHSQFVVTLMAACDLLVTAAAWGISYWLRFHSDIISFQESQPPGLEYIQQAAVITLLLTLLVFSQWGLYRPRRIQSMIPEFGEIIRACSVVWLLEVGICYFLHKPRMSAALQGLFLGVWPVTMIVFRGSSRLALREFRKRGRNVRTAAIIGAGRLGQKLLQTLRRQQWTGYQISYFVEDYRVGQEFLGVPVEGPVSRVDEIIAANPVDAVFVALSHSQSGRLPEVLLKSSSNMVDLYIVPDLPGCHYLRHQMQQIGRLPLIGLTDSPQGGLSGAVKRLMDIAICAAALAALTPLMLLVAASIKATSAGPVFHRQQRAGLGGRAFMMLKFRSMVVHKDLGAQGQWGTSRGDPRVTAVGRLLRKLSMDELPQLINVLKGDMSLVGPRPERPEFIQRFHHQIPRYLLRHHVKAGLTGWAQVNGYRGQTSLRKRVQYDLDYINRWSLRFDLYILFLTMVRGFVNTQE
ncbi:MAG: undecaprenyl-phosphate glucose phosphotransferase [Planctomycetes bacterium]|nr:undecaprenyl-phosphate glucose phosphotransferase [Planctomycetota bacterium]